MTSVLNVDSIAAKDGTSAVTLTKQTAAKAFVEANDAAAFTKSFNISAGSDDGTGDYSYSFINTLDSADMVANITCAQNSNAIGVNNGRRAASFDVKMFTDSGSLADRDHGCVVHGDLA